MHPGESPPDWSERRNRVPLHKLFGWFELAFRIWWALTCLFVLVVCLIGLSGDEPPFHWTTYALLMAAAVAGLPLGLLVLRLVRRTLEMSPRPAADDEPPAAGTSPKAQGRLDRILLGLFGAGLIAAGTYGGLHGRFYHGKLDQVGTAAPVTAWILGGVLIALGLIFLAGAVFWTATGEEQNPPRG